MSHDWTSRRILIIDHDDQFRFWAGGVFRRQQVRDAFSLANCDEALSILSRYPMDVALIELVEGKIDNLMFIQALRNIGRSPCPEIPVVAILRSADFSVLERACGFGIHGVIRKPLSGEALIKTVGGVLAKPKLFAFERLKPSSSAPGEAAQDVAALPNLTTTGRQSRPAAAITVPTGASAGTGQEDRPGNAATTLAGKTAATGLLVPPSSPPSSSPSLPPPSPSSLRPGGGASGIEAAGAPPAKISSGGLEVLDTVSPAGGIGFEAVEDASQPPKSRSVETAPAAKRRAVELVEPVKLRKGEDPAAGSPGISLEEILVTHEQWVDSRGQDGKRADLRTADLSARNLANAQLTSADLRGADLSSSDLSDAQMHGADLREADMVGTVLSGANLAVSRLRRARLIGCSVDNANLKGADLAGADLSGSKFSDADLTGAILLGAKLAGADLAGAKGLSRSQLEGVTGDAKTRLPFGLALPEN